MKIVFDTNVILDVLGKRLPFAPVSTEAMAIVEREGFVGAMTANTVTDLYFLLQKRGMTPIKIKDALMGLMETLEVLDTTRGICLSAFNSPVSDFEDAVLVESAVRWGADCIVTRNGGDFSSSPVRALSPEECIARIGG